MTDEQRATLFAEIDARRAAEDAKHDPAPIQPHWSDDPRIKSQEHYNAVKAGEVKLETPNARYVGAGEPSCYEGSPTYDRPSGYKSWRAFG